MNGTLISRAIALLLVGILGLAIGACQANADIVIDTFGGASPGASYVVNSGAGPASFNSPNSPYGWGISFGANLGSPSAINTTVNESGPITGVSPTGWGRSSNIVAPSGVFSASQVSVGIASPGLYTINLGPATTTTLKYSGASTSFTGLTGFNLTFTTLENPPVSITMTIGDGVHTESTAALPDSATGVYSVPIGDFTIGSGVNLGDLTSVTVAIGGLTNADVTLTNVTALIPQTSVPEPGPLAIWALTGIGGLGLVCTCRRRPSAKA